MKKYYCKKCGAEIDDYEWIVLEKKTWFRGWKEIRRWER